MQIFNRRSRLLLTCPKRLSSYLRQEVEALGISVLRELATGVEAEGTLADAMWLNLQTRTSHRVLFQLGEFTARTPEEMYRAVRDLPWEEYIAADGYMSVVSSVDTPSIRDTQFANVKCKDAVVDRIRGKAGMRPDSGSQRDGVVVFLYWKDQACAVYLDTSGEPLSKRGYRRIPWMAPMQESLAAAVVIETGWSGYDAFVNPMCGSGTLAIEAALAALGRPPGMFRPNFAFMHILGYDPAHWEAMGRRARSAGRRRIEGRIIVTDANPEAVTAARKNAAAAGVDHLMEFAVCDFAATDVPADGGVVVMNPEYGERLGNVRQLENTYRRIGDFLKQRCAGYTGYVFTGNADLAKCIGLRTRRRIPLYNTTIDCRLLEYELYDGSRRHPTMDEMNEATSDGTVESA
ncbi:MAG TPA: class I SAM-dependent RNA methyltransferase [Candidatus Kapabacteria bacterium]|nr:class I SAM-dependent RNA methyltransferase [Candidatus Kapabacteria bacterium]